MEYDLELVRAILRAFGAPRNGYVDTDLMATAVPEIGGRDLDEVRAHFDRLLGAGIIRNTREIRMRYHEDPVTWRPTEAGRTWVWRAWTDEQWEKAAPRLQELLTSEDTTR